MAAANGARVVKLSKSIATHQGNVNEIKFGPLNAAIMMKHRKLPFTAQYDSAGNATGVETDFGLAGKYISDLTGVDEIVLGQLNPTDFAACVGMLGSMLTEAGN